MEPITIGWEIILPFFIISGLLLVLAVINWIKAIENDNVRGNKWVWFVVIIFIYIIGPVLYFIFGRKRNQKN